VENLRYTITYTRPKQIGYSAGIDEFFVYWIDNDDVVFCLGENGKFQISWVDEVSTELFIPLGDL